MEVSVPSPRQENEMEFFDFLVRIALGFNYLVKGLFAGAGAEGDPDG